MTLSGWVNRRRDMGQLIFIDLRDRHGLTQVVIDAAESPEAHEVATGVRNEFVLRVEGKVAKRLPGTENAKLATGEIEVRARTSTVLSTAKTPPFPINEPADADETAAAEVPLPRPAPRADQPPHGACARSCSRRSRRCTTRTASSRSRRRS